MSRARYEDQLIIDNLKKMSEFDLEFSGKIIENLC